MVWTVPAGLINTIFLSSEITNNTAPLSAIATGMLIVVGPVEETSKFLAVRFGAYRTRYFEDPIHGLVYASAAALGFASLENLIYVLQFGEGVMLVRAPISTVAHLVFSSLWGYGLGVHQYHGRTRKRLLLVTLGGAALLHATFNIALFSPITWWISPLIVLIGGIWAYRRFQWGQRVSPFRNRRNYPLIKCMHCHNDVRIISSFCPHCGTVVLEQHGEMICSNCRYPNRSNALYCQRCGDRFLTTRQ
jgi:RsiW-degrading membrane proteinase PrsW (M82 family)